MKRFLSAWLISIVLFSSNAYCSDFSSAISQINAAGFPRIEVFLKVFNKQPEELKTDNFTISEDSQRIASFTLEFRKSRHYMTLVIDRSSSIEPAMNQVKAAAAEFVKNMTGDVSLSILSFGSDLDFTHEFSTDGKSLVDAINKIRPYGGTALYDAIHSACEELHNKAGRNDLKTVVCLTDGRDSTPNGRTPLSTKTPAQVNKLASENGIRLITVGLGNDIDVAVLKGFAQSTGGWYLQATSAGQLAKLYEALSRRMKLEKYYRLIYATPRPETDGSKRLVDITSSLKDKKDQGTGHYNAPTRQVSRPETGRSNGSGRFSLTEVFSNLEIAGPDTVYLTAPIIVPPSRPVHGPNGASFVGSSREECQAIIDQARNRVSDEHQRNYQMQQKYLQDYSGAIERMQKANDAWAARADVKDYEKPRIEYRNVYLQFRRDKIDLYTQQYYERYLVDLKASTDEIDYLQGVKITDQPEDDNFFSANSASRSAALDVIDKKYEGLQKKLEEKEDRHFNDTADSRGSNVDFSTTQQTREIDLPGSHGSVSDIKDALQQISGNDEQTDIETEEQTLPAPDEDYSAPEPEENSYDSDNSASDNDSDSDTSQDDVPDSDYDATTKATGKH